MVTPNATIHGPGQGRWRLASEAEADGFHRGRQTMIAQLRWVSSGYCHGAPRTWSVPAPPDAPRSPFVVLAANPTHACRRSGRSIRTRLPRVSGLWTPIARLADSVERLAACVGLRVARLSVSPRLGAHVLCRPGRRSPTLLYHTVTRAPGQHTYYHWCPVFLFAFIFAAWLKSWANANLTSCDRRGANERAAGGRRMRRPEQLSRARSSPARERPASRRRPAPRPD